MGVPKWPNLGFWQSWQCDTSNAEREDLVVDLCKVKQVDREQRLHSTGHQGCLRPENIDDLVLLFSVKNRAGLATSYTTIRRRSYKGIWLRHK